MMVNIRIEGEEIRREYEGCQAPRHDPAMSGAGKSNRPLRKVFESRVFLCCRDLPILMEVDVITKILVCRVRCSGR